MSDNNNPKLTMILEWVGPGQGPEAFQLWACRGEKKGCRKKQLKKRHCADCFLPDETDDRGRREANQSR